MFLKKLIFVAVLFVANSLAQAKKVGCDEIKVNINMVLQFSIDELSFQVEIGVHYESRCPDSKNFVLDELKKAYPSIKDQVDITYYPLGKSSSYKNEDGTIGFECQHGKPECDRNMLQNCALNSIGKKNQDLQTSYIICAMDFSKDQNKCIEDAGLDLADTLACFHGQRGIELQLQTEKDSGPVINQSRFVPTIVYNGVYNQELSYDSLDDFAKVVRKVARQLNE